MGSIYYKGFSEEEITQFEEYSTASERILRSGRNHEYFCIKDQIQNMNIVIGCTVGVFIMPAIM